MKKLFYRLAMLMISAWTLNAVFNGFDMTMDKPITGLPMIPDQLYTDADSDPVQKVVPKKRIKNRRARYRQAVAYRMIQTSQPNDTLFPWVSYTKRENKRIENF